MLPFYPYKRDRAEGREQTRILARSLLEEALAQPCSGQDIFGNGV